MEFLQMGPYALGFSIGVLMLIGVWLIEHFDGDDHD